MNLEDRFYTSTEVAEILGVSLRSVYRYLEEDKLQAEVKTATGRHRFTRKNILDFLYPQEDSSSHPVSSNSVNNSGRTPQAPMQAPMNDFGRSARPNNVTSFAEVPVPSSTAPQTPPSQNDSYYDIDIEMGEDEDTANVEANSDILNDVSPVEAKVSPEDSEEEVDWLAKFRAAAQRHREKKEAEEAMSQEVKEPIVTTPPVRYPSSPQQNIAPTNSRDDFMNTVSRGLANTAQSIEMPTEESSIYYYKSSSAGLKELAQQINNVSRKANVPYAFTLNAGMSLHKLIKPFSLLHIYSRAQDRIFFENSLDLTPADKNSAQLGILVDSGALGQRKEVHGLYVVSDQQLHSDLIRHGEQDLAEEFEEVASL